MHVFIRHSVLILFMWLMLAGVCLGREVYLKDGSIIDSQSVWRQGDKVFVKVNQDIVADFNSNEIDLRSTFPKTGSSSRHVQRKVAAAVATEADKSAPPVKVVTKSDQKAAVQPNPVAAKPAPKPVAPSAPALVAKESPQPDATTSTAAEPEAQPDKAEQQRRAQEAAKMMVEAAMKKDPEMMKKALEMQKSAMLQPQGAAPQIRPAFPLSVLLALLVICILIVASQWIVFEKGGEAGWKCLVPFYNMYVLMEISGKPGWWMFLLFVPLVGVAFLLFAMLSLARKFGRSELFGVGLLFLPMIFLPLLAFGGSEYQRDEWNPA